MTPDEIRAALRDYLESDRGLVAARRARDEPTGSAPGPWQGLVSDVGLAAMGSSEGWGGLGLGFAHLVAAVEECARQLTPGPWREAVLLGVALGARRTDTVMHAQALTQAIAGERIVGLASFQGAIEASDPTQVTGELPAVTHGERADVVIAVLTVDGAKSIAAVLVPADASRYPHEVLDITTPRATISVSAAPMVLLTDPEDPESFERFRTIDRVLLAAEQVGGAQGCLNAMVEHSLVREQFGQLIGTYQAIQHHCANTAIEVAGARAIVSAAARALDGDPELAVLANPLGLLARASASECFTNVSSRSVQVAGGIGFTWEHDAHLFFRRARSTAAIEGTPTELRRAAVDAGCLDLLTVSNL